MDIESEGGGYRRTRSKKIFSPFRVVITPQPGQAIKGPRDFNIMDALQEENVMRMRQEDDGDGYPSENEVELEDENEDEAADEGNVASGSGLLTNFPTVSSLTVSSCPVSPSLSPLANALTSSPVSSTPYQRAPNKATKRRKYKPVVRAKRAIKRENEQQDLEDQYNVRVKRVALKKAAAAKTHGLPDADLATAPVSSSGWVGRRQRFEKEHVDLESAFRDGLHLLDWQADDTYAIVDRNNVAIAVLGAPPPGQHRSDWQAVIQNATSAVEEARTKIPFTDKEKNHRRGDFPAAAYGISFGGGQKRPGILKHSKKTNTVLRNLLASPSFTRISGYANSLFRTFAPRTYEYYIDGLAALRRWNPRLSPNYPRTAFAASTWNFGPSSVSYPHTDNGNVAFGWCAITAMGNYDPDRGGHLILWDLGLVIRFPPGATILIPSALLVHSNVDIQEGESRYSYIQYSAGGLFRWIYNGFQNEERWRENASASDVEKAAADRKERAKKGLAMFSSINEIIERYKKSK